MPRRIGSDQAIQREPVALPTTARGQATRRRLLRSAEACFARYGYAATSVAEISRRSKVAHGSFYVYFASKQAIFEELIRNLAHEIRVVTRAAMADSASRVDAELAGTTAFFGWLQEHRDLHRILHLVDEVDPALAVEFYSSIADGYAEGLAHAMDAGEVQRVDPEVLAYALMGINQFVSMRWILWTGAKPAPETLADVARIISGALRGADRPDTP